MCSEAANKQLSERPGQSADTRARVLKSIDWAVSLENVALRTSYQQAPRLFVATDNHDYTGRRTGLSGGRRS